MTACFDRTPDQRICSSPCFIDFSSGLMSTDIMKMISGNLGKNKKKLILQN